MTTCSLVWKSSPMPENRLIAATALAGARKSAKPVRHSLVLDACQMAPRASVKICRNWKEDFPGLGNSKVGIVPSTTHAPRPRPIHCTARCETKDMTASEPKAPPPRLATLVQPLTEPRSLSGVNSAVQPLTAPANNTMPSSASNNRAVVAASRAGESKISPVARQIAEMVAVNQQYARRVNPVSITGCKRNPQKVGDMTVALMPATWYSGIPWWVSRKGSAVMVKPITRPKGKMAMPTTQGGGIRTASASCARNSSRQILL